MTACDNLKEWADTWQLQIASEKCFVQRVTNQNVYIEQTANLKSPYILDKNQRNWSKETRDLGITLDSKLTFNQHISFIVHKAHIQAVSCSNDLSSFTTEGGLHGILVSYGYGTSFSWQITDT